MVAFYACAVCIVAGAFRLIGRIAGAAGLFPFGALVDAWSVTFLALLGVVSTVVFVWSYYYIDSEPSYRRFLGILVAFIGSIVSLVLFSTLFRCLVG